MRRQWELRKTSSRSSLKSNFRLFSSYLYFLMTLLNVAKIPFVISQHWDKLGTFWSSCNYRIFQMYSASLFSRIKTSVLILIVGCLTLIIIVTINHFSLCSQSIVIFLLFIPFLPFFCLPQVWQQAGRRRLPSIIWELCPGPTFNSEQTRMACCRAAAQFAWETAG